MSGFNRNALLKAGLLARNQLSHVNGGCAWGSFVLANSNDIVLSPGFTTAAGFFWTNKSDDPLNTEGQADCFLSFGIAVYDGSAWQQGTVGSRALDNLSSAQKSGGFFRGSSCVCSVSTSASPGIAFELAVSSRTSTTLTLQLTSGAAPPSRIHYLLLSDQICTNAKGVTFNDNNTTGNQDVTSLSFQPNLLVALSTRDNNQLGGNTEFGDDDCGVGFYDGTNQFQCAHNFEAATTNPDAHRYFDSTRLYVQSNDGKNFFRYGQGAGFLSNGFTINVQAAPVIAWNRVVFALQLTNVKVLTFNTRTDGTGFNTGTIGFLPEGFLAMSHCTAESTSLTRDTDLKHTIGGGLDENRQSCIAGSMEDTTNPGEASNHTRYDCIYCRPDLAGGSEGRLAVTGMDATDIDLVMDDPDPDAAIVGLIAFGPAGEAGVPFLPLFKRQDNPLLRM